MAPTVPSTTSLLCALYKYILYIHSRYFHKNIIKVDLTILKSNYQVGLLGITSRPVTRYTKLKYLSHTSA